MADNIELSRKEAELNKAAALLRCGRFEVAAQAERLQARILELEREIAEHKEWLRSRPR